MNGLAQIGTAPAGLTADSPGHCDQLGPTEPTETGRLDAGGDADVGVAEEFLDHDEIDALFQGQGGSRVEVVEADGFLQGDTSAGGPAGASQ
jgi:hypothetical protein